MENRLAPPVITKMKIITAPLSKTNLVQEVRIVITLQWGEKGQGGMPVASGVGNVQFLDLGAGYFEVYFVKIRL